MPGPGRALALSELLLAVALEDAASWPGPVALSPSAVADGAWAGALLARPVEVVPQPAGNLGDRIMAVDQDLRRRGHRHLVFIGSDAPTLSGTFYATRP